MKPTTNYRQTACRLLAGLFFLCLFAPVALGQNNPVADDNWQNHVATKIDNDGGGNGTDKDNPILIASAAELAYFAQQVNSNAAIEYDSSEIQPNGKDGDVGGFFGYYFALSTDIDLKEHYWTPIGTGNTFKGNFDGKGHCVSGLKVNVNTGAGLFGYANPGTIQNLGVCIAKEGVRGVANRESIYAGGIAGQALNIHNCYVVGEGSIEINGGTDSGYAGGIVGYLYDSGSLTNCYATVDIKIEGDRYRYAGGIVGYCNFNSTISCTYATGDVETGTGPYHFYAGGICGYLNGISTIENSLALNGRITGGNDAKDNSFSNRIVGKKEGGATLSTNYASPEIQVNGSPVGSEAQDDANGNPDVNLDNFDKVIIWGDGWNTFDKTHLPKLKIRKGDGPGYADWPVDEGFTPQSPPDATLYLIANKIANNGGGNGSGWDKAILIANRAELAYLAKQVNAGGDLTVNGGSIENKGSDNSGFKGIYFALSADIALSAYYWTPIGTSSKPFNGNFDGQGHCVSGLKIDGAVEYAGLFGNAKGGTFRNLGVRLAQEGVFGIIVAGGIAGLATNINNCYVVGNGMVKAGPHAPISSAGGIVGYICGSLSNCYATIDVMAEGNDSSTSYAGGIVGYGEFSQEVEPSSVSYTYSTGNVSVNKGDNCAGGICGITFGALFSNLAANGKIEGEGSYIHRIVGRKRNEYPFNSNYASGMTLVNGVRVTGGDAYSWDGTPSYLSTFVGDLTDADWNSEKGWQEFSTGTNLPQLMMRNQADNGYEPWNPKACKQPVLKAEDYLLATPKLHIVSRTGGTLKVTDKGGNELPEVSDIRPGTLLTLSYTEDANYRFSGYHYSTISANNLVPLSDNPVMMPATDLWLGASFTYQEPTPPPPPPAPVYYTVTLPQIEGATTDPVAGSYEVESWDTFRFYLTIDTAYSQSQPIVTTSRGETLVPRMSDGAYLVKYVRDDIEIFIDGLEKNPPVANETIGTAGLVPKIWAEGSMLCIRMAEALPSAPVRIFTPDGRLHASFASTPGLNRRQLPTGMYIVRVGDMVRKVLVRQ